jgi:hypothetical protein
VRPLLGSGGCLRGRRGRLPVDMGAPLRRRLRPLWGVSVSSALWPQLCWPSGCLHGSSSPPRFLLDGLLLAGSVVSWRLLRSWCPFCRCGVAIVGALEPALVDA